MWAQPEPLGSWRLPTGLPWSSGSVTTFWNVAASQYFISPLALSLRLPLTKETSWPRPDPLWLPLITPHPHPCFPFQLQRFKRSLSLKTILRSKSVENFFLRSGSELKCPTEVLLTPPTPLPPPSPPPASTDGSFPTPAPSPCPILRPLAPLKPVRLHSFQEHVFKRASPCELCHQIIVGRCLACQGEGPG